MDDTSADRRFRGTGRAAWRGRAISVVMGALLVGISGCAGESSPKGETPIVVTTNDATAQAGENRASPAPARDPLSEAASDEVFGEPIAAKGDVTVYTTRRSGNSLTVPVKITNTGGKRTFYTVDIRVTGPGGFKDTVRVETEVVGVYPGASWPVELTAESPGAPLPENPRVTIVSVVERSLAS